MEDPRTQFQAGKDRQVLVLFEWQGPVGRHHCEGAWKDPGGRVVFTSTADVDARGPRFSVYWGLSLPDTVATGTWVVEATVDGESAGVHAFQIVAAPVASSPATGRRALAVAELYQQGVAATLVIEGLDGEGTIAGLTTGDLVMPEFAGGADSGTPVLNEFGELVGTAAGPVTLPGATTLDLVMLGPDDGSWSRGGRIRGLPPLPAEGPAPRTLEDRDRAGEFVRPLAHTPHFVHGVLGTDVARQGDAQVRMAVDQRLRFSRREKSCVVFVTWSPGRKEDSPVAFQLFDEDNRHVGGTEPRKAKLRAGEPFVQYWTIPVPRLLPGIYRVDVMLGPDPVWRTFFRVTE